MSKDLGVQDWNSDQDDNVYYNPEDLEGLNIVNLEELDNIQNDLLINANNINHIQNKEFVMELYGKDYFNPEIFEGFKFFIKEMFNIEIEWDI